MVLVSLSKKMEMNILGKRIGFQPFIKTCTVPLMEQNPYLVLPSQHRHGGPSDR